MDRSSLGKRRAPLQNLQRRVKARKNEPEPEELFSEESDDDGSHSGQDSEDDSKEEGTNEVSIK